MSNNDTAYNTAMENAAMVWKLADLRGNYKYNSVYFIRY